MTPAKRPRYKWQRQCPAIPFQMWESGERRQSLNDWLASNMRWSLKRNSERRPASHLQINTLIPQTVTTHICSYYSGTSTCGKSHTTGRRHFPMWMKWCVKRAGGQTTNFVNTLRMDYMATSSQQYWIKKKTLFNTPSKTTSYSPPMRHCWSNAKNMNEQIRLWRLVDMLRV